MGGDQDRPVDELISAGMAFGEYIGFLSSRGRDTQIDEDG